MPEPFDGSHETVGAGGGAGGPLGGFGLEGGSPLVGGGCGLGSLGGGVPSSSPPHAIRDNAHMAIGNSFVIGFIPFLRVPKS